MNTYIHTYMLNIHSNSKGVPVTTNTVSASSFVHVLAHTCARALYVFIPAGTLIPTPSGYGVYRCAGLKMTCTYVRMYVCMCVCVCLYK